MTITLNEHRKNIEPELKTLLLDAALNIKSVWFGDNKPADLQTPSVNFMLMSAPRNDMQVIQSSSRISRNLEYDVSCMYSGSEGNQTYDNAATFVDSVYNTLQKQHAPGQRLNGTCFDIECDDIIYGFVVLELKERVFMTGGVIKLVVQVIELF